jgi:hypothetical protein
VVIFDRQVRNCPLLLVTRSQFSAILPCDELLLFSVLPNGIVMTTNFKDLKFGYASAEIEGANEPLLLVDGYFNQEGIIGEARNSSKFLFLGYKGSGKSAIGEHLRNYLRFIRFSKVLYGS